MKKEKPANSNVAKGATLYSSGKKVRDKSKRNEKQELEPGRTFYNEALDPHFEDKLVDYLLTQGIEVSSYKKRYILRRLRVRMGRIKLKSYKDYLDYVKTHPDELKEIQESLSINVTRFFRNRDTFEKLKRDILPELMKTKKTIKIWSAGCAVGPEPYSLAMICADVFPSNVRVNILATDVKEELLKIARYGVYAKPYLDELTDGEKSKYFVQTSDGDFKIKPHVKSLVNFQKHDLMKDPFPKNIDLVVCRNVLIYVDREAQNKILNGFFESLSAEGIVVLGRTETLFGDWRRSVDIISTKHRIYQKKSANVFKPIEYQPIEPRSQAESSIKRRESLRAPQKVQNERLRELRNFRETFEERKKAWELRLEQTRRSREARIASREKGSVTSSTRRQVQRASTSMRARKQTPSNDEMDKAKETGSLTKYRSLLKKTEEPTRESRIRRDLKK